MVFPCPQQDENDNESILVAEECYCPNGHNLVDGKAKFSNFDGILLKIESEDGSKSGFIAMSPICGDKTRICMDFNLKQDELYKLFCPTCNTKLPIYSDCSCGGSLVTLFNTTEENFNDSFCVCNRFGCHKSVVNEVEDSYSTAKLQTRWNKYK